MNSALSMCLCVCVCVCTFVCGPNDTGHAWKGKRAVRERQGRLELLAVVLFKPPLWLMPGIPGQTFAAEHYYLISCLLQK